MICLIASATALEIAPFLDYYRKNDKIFHPDKGIDVVITGIGLTAATWSLTKQIHTRRPDMIIQAGIAGTFKKELTPGTVVTVDQDTIGDESVMESEKLKTLFDLQLRDKDEFPWSGGWLVNPHTPLLELTGLKIVNAVSVNHITTSVDMKRLYKKKFDPSLESMEGAALHYVGLQENVPFIQLRGISNHVRERNKKHWNLNESIKNLNQELISLINAL